MRLSKETDVAFYTPILDPLLRLFSLHSASPLTIFSCREYTLADVQTLPDTDGPSTSEERDLDDEVPDADEEGDGDWINEDDDEDDVHDAQGHPHDFHHGNMVTMVLGRDNMGMDAEGDMEYAQGERDLDDDIPEGMEGSYQHTDTDVEDESDFEESEPEAEAQGNVLDSSVWGSSGAAISRVDGALPPSGGARGATIRRSAGRMPGREN